MQDQAHNLRCLAKDEERLLRENGERLTIGARLADVVRRLLARTSVLIWGKHAEFNTRLAEAVAEPQETDF
jgi:hypothetical protein